MGALLSTVAPPHAGLRTPLPPTPRFIAPPFRTVCDSFRALACPPQPPQTNPPNTPLHHAPTVHPVIHPPPFLPPPVGLHCTHHCTHRTHSATCARLALFHIPHFSHPHFRT